MGKNQPLFRGDSQTLRLSIQGNWDDVQNFALSIYAEKSNKRLKVFQKSDLIITDPSSGIALATLTGAETEKADVDNYIVECKYKIADQEKTKRGYWGRFTSTNLEKEHFNG